VKKPRKKKVWRCKQHNKKYTVYADFIAHRRRRHAEAVAKGKEASNRQNYGQSAAEYDTQLKQQGNKCVTCGRPMKNVNLHQEHNHKIAKLKIRVVWDGKGSSKLFTATNDEYKYSHTSHSRKKAVRMVRIKLKRRSRRGITCWHCNAAIKKVEDNWKVAIAIGKYLKHWDEEQGWDSIKKESMK